MTYIMDGKYNHMYTVECSKNSRIVQVLIGSYMWFADVWLLVARLVR